MFSFLEATSSRPVQPQRTRLEAREDPFRLEIELHGLEPPSRARPPGKKSDGTWGRRMGGHVRDSQDHRLQPSTSFFWITYDFSSTILSPLNR